VNGAHRERIAVIGGGIGGLALALALAEDPVDVVLFERDPPPPEMDPLDAFDRWERKGVPQFRHSHIFLGRLHALLAARHPEFLAELREAGVGARRIEDLVAAHHVASYRAQGDTAELCELLSRRATFEYVLRRHVERLPNVRFAVARVTGLIAEQKPEGLLVRGVRLDDGSEYRAEVTVDASGVRSRVPHWLTQMGGSVQTEVSGADFFYFSRHYVLREGEVMPTGARISLGDVRAVVFVAERRHFSIALSFAASERRLAEIAKQPDGFDFVCRQMAVLRPWLECSTPASKVIGAGSLYNTWSYWVRNGRVGARGLFAIGDALLRTNPVYGQGTSLAFIEAHQLAEALRATSDGDERARTYAKSVWRTLRPHFDCALRGDALVSALGTQRRAGRISWKNRIMDFGFRQVWQPAFDESKLVKREWLRLIQMRRLSHPLIGVMVVLRCVWLWLLRTISRRRARVLEPELTIAVIAKRYDAATNTADGPHDSGVRTQGGLVYPETTSARGRRESGPTHGSRSHHGNLRGV
jgi:2-polyprenyl-6-methoxyphenol hydroxylase-like FAD-dependent oxidoreductase